jgi:hypothetical protein
MDKLKVFVEFSIFSLCDLVVWRLIFRVKPNRWEALKESGF